MKLYKKEKRWHLKFGKHHIHGPKLWDVLKGIRMTFIMVVIFFSCNAQSSNPVIPGDSLSILTPVKLKSFTAVQSAHGVLLTWITETEVNNDHFTIYTADEDGEFVALIEINGNGTTNDEHKYTVIVPYHCYFRLSQTDYDGSMEIFPPIAYNGPIIESKAKWYNLITGIEEDHEMLGFQLKIENGFTYKIYRK